MSELSNDGRRKDIPSRSIRGSWSEHYSNRASVGKRAPSPHSREPRPRSGSFMGMPPGFPYPPDQFLSQPLPPGREIRSHSGSVRSLTSQSRPPHSSRHSRESRSHPGPNGRLTPQPTSQVSPPRQEGLSENTASSPAWPDRVMSTFDVNAISSSGILGTNLYRYDPLGPSEIRLVMLHPARS